MIVKTAKLKFDGKPINLQALGSVTERIKRVADVLADDDLLSLARAAQRAGVSTQGVRTSEEKLVASGYALRDGTHVYIGKPVAIQALRRLLESSRRG